MSYKRFTGWEPVTETAHEYDDTGRLVRTVTEREPEWDEQERAWMLALEAYEADGVCPSCGGPASVCQDPGNEGRFEVPAPTRCHVTTAIALAQDGYEKARVPRALLFGARLKG